jgi:ABC-type antimicrobial peptide transport system permease subunit
MALLYTAIAIINILVMAVRVRDLAQLRLAGATRRQALRTTAWEAAAIAALGVLLGLAVTAITIVAVPAVLRRIGSAATVTVPLEPDPRHHSHQRASRARAEHHRRLPRRPAPAARRAANPRMTSPARMTARLPSAGSRSWSLATDLPPPSPKCYAV